MPEHQLQDLIDGFRGRLQEALDAQLGTLATSHAQAIEEARRAAEADAEQAWSARVESTRNEWTARVASEVESARAEAERQWAGKLDALRAEWEARLAAEVESARAEAEQQWASRLDSVQRDSDARVAAAVEAARAETEQRWSARVDSIRDEWSRRLESEVAAARGEAERRLVAEAMRVRVEAEQSAADAAAAARREMEDALARERERAAAASAGEQERVERELREARSALDAERRRGEQSIAQVKDDAADLDAARLVAAMGTLDAAGSLSAVLGALAHAARAEAPRAAVFVVNGPQLEEWSLPQLPALSHEPVRISGPDAGILGAAAGGDVQFAGPGHDGAMPPFASLLQGRAAVAAPLLVGAQAVAVLYADEGRASEPPAAWRDAIQILARHASACLAFITAARTAQAMRLMPDATAGRAEANALDDEQGARRFARLLLSEIKLYNETAVRSGREKRDLRRRLQPEIDRARRLFDERVPPSVAVRDACFEQELVLTLADGDPSLLG